MKKIISIILLIAMLCGLGVNVSAYSGAGTELNPYVITTPDELMNMKNDLSAHYILGNSIDMSGVWYEPVGNEIDGAFTGSLDGRGYTIRNLDLDLEGSKYVGLFGYLNGTVKNVNLTNVVASGYRYVGGIAGYAADNSTIYNCDVSGEFNGQYISGDTYIGGIVGYDHYGTIASCSNNSDVFSHYYAGGIAGYNNYGTITTCTNNGGVSNGPYIGGITGYNNYGTITSCANNGGISGEDYAGGITGYGNYGTITSCTNNGNMSDGLRVGGIVGYSYDEEITNCTNNGTVNASYLEVCAGGIAGTNCSTITNCNNYANIVYMRTNDVLTSDFDWDDYDIRIIGGICGRNSGNINSCSNYGEVLHAANSGGICGINYADITNCYNANIAQAAELMIYYGYWGTSHYYRRANAGGIAAINTGSITKCENTASITTVNLLSEANTKQYPLINEYVGGIVGINGYYGNVSNCKNGGLIKSNWHGGGIVGKTSNSNYYEITSCISTALCRAYFSSSDAIAGNISGRQPLNCYQLLTDSCKTEANKLEYMLFKDVNNFSGLDIQNTWENKVNIESGFLQLKNIPSHIDLNECIEIFDIDDSDRLYAYIDGVSEDVTWSCDNSDIAYVLSNGTVTAKGVGVCTVTATNEEGMKANCLIYVYDKADTVEISPDDINVAIGSSLTLSTTQSPNTELEPVIWESNDTSVATIEKWNGVVKGIKSGTAIITATTVYSGISATCKVKVTGSPVTKLSLSKTSASINKDDNLQLTVSVTPSAYDGQITWSSSNESVASVDSNGLVSAKYPGIANIYAQAESGVTAQCTVTVKAPATEIKLNKSELTLQTGYTEKLLTDMLPEYTTDIVSWASSNPSYASVSADGTVTAKAVGQVIITATTTSGEKSHCTVNIVNPPIPVTSVTLDKTQLIMTKADTAQLNATVLPDNATDKNLVWTSSDESVATVNSTGVVTAVASGSAIISATSANGYYHECSVQVIAANGASFVATSTKAMPGDIAEYTVSVVKNPGMSYYKLSLKYDNMLLEPIEIINKNTSGSFSHNLADDEKTGLNLMWFSQSDNAENTDLFTIRFRVSDYAKLGEEIPIAMSYGESDIKNSSGNKLAFFLSDASIAVKEPLPGDVNEDGEIDFFDITALSRGVAEIEELTARQMIAADVNDDSVVDIKDNVKLLQYVVGWSGVELMSIGEDEPTINISTEKINEAGEADINVSVKGNTGFSGFKFVIEYNPEEVEILSVTPNENILPERFLTNFGLSDKLVVTWYNTNDINSNGTLFTLRVKTKDGFNGEYSPIRIAYADNNICDDKLENVDFFYNEGYVMTDDYIVLKEYISDTEYACVLKFAEVQKEQDAKAIIAFYDENGKFVQLASSDITVNPDMVEIHMDFDKKAYSTYKLMIWEGFDNLKPIVKAK